jgi:hypothetical protein
MVKNYLIDGQSTLNDPKQITTGMLKTEENPKNS